MEQTMIKTSVYLPEDLHRRLKKLAIDRGLKDTEAMQQAIRDWIAGKPTTGTVRTQAGNRWLEMLSAILASDNEDAISAVQQNLEVFFSYVKLKKQ